MSRRKEKSLDDLDLFLAGSSEETLEDVQKDLRSQGVNLPEFIKQIHATVQNGYSEQLKAIAETERDSQPVTILEQLKKMSRAAMLSLFEELRSGAYGENYQELAVARCRDKDATELSDAELRSWLEDISATLGSPRK